MLVVDTDVVSIGFRQDPVFVDFYGPALQGNEAVVSFMSIAELEYGMRRRWWGDRRVEGLRRYLSGRYARYGVSRELIAAWASLTDQAQSRGRVLSTADGWVAATALVLSVPLVSHNARDFDYLEGIDLITHCWGAPAGS